MHGTLPEEGLTTAPQLAVPTYFCCVRLKVEAHGSAPRYTPWFPVSPAEYAAMLERQGYPLPYIGHPIRDFSSGPVEGRTIYHEHQIAGWDCDLRALYDAHRQAHARA